MQYNWTLDESTLYSLLNKFMPSSIVLDFVQELRNINAIITEQVALALLLSMTSKSAETEDDQWYSNGLNRDVDVLKEKCKILSLEVPSHMKRRMTQWISDMQFLTVEKTGHSIHFVAQNQEQDTYFPIHCVFKHKTDPWEDTFAWFKTYGSAFNCFFDGRRLYARYLRATWTGYYAPLQQNSDADKTKEEQRVYQSFGLLEKNLDAETQESEFDVVFTKNHENKQQDADVFMDSLFHTYMKNHPEKKISFRDIKSFCRETKQQLTEELKVKESNKRRIHNMISNARKLVILDDESDSDLSSQIKSIPAHLMEKQKSIVNDYDTCQERFTNLDHLLDDKPQKVANCAICKNRVVDSVLPQCGHVMCMMCSTTLTNDTDDDSDSEDGSIVCPFCHEISYGAQQLYGLVA